MIFRCDYITVILIIVLVLLIYIYFSMLCLDVMAKVFLILGGSGEWLIFFTSSFVKIYIILTIL